MAACPSAGGRQPFHQLQPQANMGKGFLSAHNVPPSQQRHVWGMKCAWPPSPGLRTPARPPSLEQQPCSPASGFFNVVSWAQTAAQVQTPPGQLHTKAALTPGSSATALQDWHWDTKRLQWDSWDQLHDTQGCSQHRYGVTFPSLQLKGSRTAVLPSGQIMPSSQGLWKRKAKNFRGL